MPRCACALAIACLIPAMPGCLIVVDHENDVHWASGDGDAPRHAIGVYLDSVHEATAAQLGLDRARTTLITGIIHDSAAERAGLQRYDIITSVDGDADASPTRVRSAIRGRPKGEQVSLVVLRQGKPVTIAVQK